MGNMFGFAAIMDGVGSKQVMSGLLESALVLSGCGGRERVSKSC